MGRPHRALNAAAGQRRHDARFAFAPRSLRRRALSPHQDYEHGHDDRHGGHDRASRKAATRSHCWQADPAQGIWDTLIVEHVDRRPGLGLVLRRCGHGFLHTPGAARHPRRLRTSVSQPGGALLPRLVVHSRLGLAPPGQEILPLGLTARIIGMSSAAAGSLGQTCRCRSVSGVVSGASESRGGCSQPIPSASLFARLR